MGDPFTDVTVTNYNDNAPPDDGTEVPANKVSYATIKDELSDPLKTAVESLVTNTGAAVDKLIGGGGVTSTTAAYTVQATDQGKLVRITNSGTVTTATAATVGAPFVHGILNDGGGTLTIDGAGSETIDGQANITLPDGAGVWLFTDGTNWYTVGRGNIQDASSFVTPYPRGHIGGLALSNNATDSDHDIDIAVGTARDAGDSFNFSITSTHTKRIDASWASGSSNGGLASAVSLSANTTYHVFLVDDGSGTTEAGFDTSLTATNLLSDSGGSKYRRIGSVITDGSNNIRGFTQVDEWFLWDDPPLDIDNSAPGTSANTAAISVPSGFKVLARVNIRFGSSDGVYVSSPDQNDEAPSNTTAPLAHISDGANSTSEQIQVATDASAQIRYRCSSNNSFRLATLAYQDARGRND